MKSRDVVMTGVSLAYNLISKVTVRSRKLYSSAALLLSSVGTAGASVACTHTELADPAPKQMRQNVL